jgi:hypothetical protein
MRACTEHKKKQSVVPQLEKPSINIPIPLPVKKAM